MRTEDKYHKYVEWSDEDQLYIGFCPDLFPAGGVCHGKTPVEAYQQLCEIVEDTVATAKAEKMKLPPPSTRPMRDAVPA